MKIFFTLFLFWALQTTSGQTGAETPAPFLNKNKPARMEWFKDLGSGMFVHFGIDSQLGVVISHSMAGASRNYLDRFVNELPQSFNPGNFNPDKMATLAKLAGMKYIVFTAKHHAGFCMWNTRTTPFNIMNTPYGKDLLGEYVEATRNAGLAVGLYYSPEDFNFLYQHNMEVRRKFPEPLPSKIMKEYLELVELQCMELMAQYGDIDLIFLDGGEGPLQEKCKEVVWDLHPDIVVTRGAINTPEQQVPGISSETAWESCITMGTQWAWKPTNEKYKSGKRLIEILIETRAKGGNLLLNVGPRPDGAIPPEQENRLREMAAWNFINQEAVTNTVPWIVPREKNTWFTWKPQKKTLYAFLTKIPDWPRGTKKDFVIRSVTTTENSEISVLGQSGKLVEYQPQTDASTKFQQTKEGLRISCVRAQRIYNNHQWNNPVVLKITNARPALVPPEVATQEARIIEKGSEDVLHFRGRLFKTGDTDSLEVGFEYREYAGFAEALYSDQWMETPTIKVPPEDRFNIQPELKKNGRIYQFRAFAEHPRLRVYGEVLQVDF